MKRIFSLILSFSLLLTSPTLIFAQIPSPTLTSIPKTTIVDKEKNDTLTEQITELKEKIASRVAQLRLVEKKSVAGVVLQRSGTQITLTDLNNQTQTIDVDEITKFVSSKDSFGISDISKDMKISVIGTYNKQSKRILARFVEVITIPIFISGVIMEKNTKEFFIRVTDIQNKEVIVDIETSTKSSSFTDDTIVKVGFTKILPNQRVIVVGTPGKDDSTRISATRILVLPDAPKPLGLTPQSEAIDTTPTPIP